MHARDAAVVRATFSQIRTMSVVDTGDQAGGLKGCHRRFLGTIAGFRVIRRQTIFHALHTHKKYDGQINKNDKISLQSKFHYISNIS